MEKGLSIKEKPTLFRRRFFHSLAKKYDMWGLMIVAP